MSSAVEAIVDENTDSVGLFTFYQTMDRKGRFTFWACTAGWTLDGMDFMLFPLVIGTLASAWGMDLATAGSISSLTLLCSAAVGSHRSCKDDANHNLPVLRRQLVVGCRTGPNPAGDLSRDARDWVWR
jgi:hypothetical protein